MRAWLGFVMALGLAGAALAACAGDPARDSAWTLAGHPGLLHQVKVFYERRALEENGYCPAPLMEGVSRAEVLAEDEESLVIDLQYRYRDSLKDERRATLFRECVGFAGRTFTIAKRTDGLQVVAMSGPQRGSRGVAQ